ncbi:MAG TPA: LEPR-XLL domain-containing protein, partial [Opitutaceae bacterium]|nr:LEPR-XLL domain-containing protein [Opitutaceae bacterium]
MTQEILVGLTGTISAHLTNASAPQTGTTPQPSFAISSQAQNNRLGRRQDAFDLEALEPRLLLSADGLAAVHGTDSLIEKDINAQNPAAVVVEFSVASDAESSSAVQSEAAVDDIFDVAGQTIEAAVETNSDEAEGTVEAAVETTTSNDAASGSDEPEALYSIYDGGSAMTQQLTESLNAANAPPSQVDGDTENSPVSANSITADGTVLHTQDLSVFAQAATSGGDFNDPPTASSVPATNGEIDKSFSTDAVTFRIWDDAGTITVEVKVNDVVEENYTGVNTIKGAVISLNDTVIVDLGIDIKWDITGFNSGTITGTGLSIAFEQVENIQRPVGDTNKDTIILDEAGVIT